MRGGSTRSRWAAALSLILILPAPSLANWLGMSVVPNTIWAPILFSMMKVWMVCLPLAWLIWVEQRPLGLSPMRKGGGLAGVVTGMVIAATIGFTYLIIGPRLIDQEQLRGMMAEIGLGELTHYVGGAVYWVTANSLLEEFVWRWFVVYQARKFMSARAAIVFSAAGFTVHHIVATSLYFSPGVVALISSGIFVGGCIWSWLYVRYDSIWPSYISHVIADLAVFIIGYRLIFG